MLLDPVTNIKLCSNPECSETSPEAFGKHKGTKDGLACYCRKCMNVKQSDYVAGNQNKIKEAQRKSYNKCRRGSDKWYKEDRKRTLAKYNLTPEQYDEMFANQEGKCRICKKPEIRLHNISGRPVSLSVDHDHACCPYGSSCGKCIRGLLCWTCNTRLHNGSEEWVIEAYKYIFGDELNGDLRKPFSGQF